MLTGRVRLVKIEFDDDVGPLGLVWLQPRPTGVFQLATFTTLAVLVSDGALWIGSTMWSLSAEQKLWSPIHC